MKKGPCVLIVDDDEDLLDMYREIFKIQDHETLTARSAQEAISLCQQCDIKVIISDSQMPEMNGVELLNHLRQVLTDFPLFYLLTGALEIEEKDILALGAHALITKPFDLNEIMRRIGKDLSEKQS